MILLAGAIMILVMLLGITIFIAVTLQPVSVHQALVINKMGRTDVTFTSAVVIPIVQRAYVLDLRVVPLSFKRMGNEGLICRDGLRVDVEVVCVFAINRTKDDVLKVAQAIGCERASAPETLRDLFEATVVDALKTCARELDFDRLFLGQESFRDTVIQRIGPDHNGYILNDLVFAFIGPTLTSAYDPENILDAQGLDKLRKRAAPD